MQTYAYQELQEEKRERIENVFEEMMAENILNLKETDIKIQEVHGVPTVAQQQET